MPSMDHAHAPQDTRKTVLLVDDDASVLKLISDVLADGDYNVLTAGSGAEALRQSRNYKNEIDVLLSDFEMPGMTGVDLATKLTAERPKLKVLLMSGFTAGMLVLNEGWHFLPKPFIASQLQSLIAGLAFPDKASRYSGLESAGGPSGDEVLAPPGTVNGSANVIRKENKC